MWTCIQHRRMTRAVLVSAAVLLVGSAAQAGPQRPRGEFSAVPPAPGPARFFTINQVLNKRDGAPSTNGLASAATGPLSDAPAPAPVATRGDEPFGMFAFRAPEGLLWVKWRALEPALRADRDRLEACRAAPERCDGVTGRFAALIANAAKTSGTARADLVNRSLNAAIRYVSDAAQHGVADRWTAPLATLSSGRGDCEDYAIAKYLALREAGVAAADLRIVLVRDLLSREDHAVLALRDDGRWLVLDNRRAHLVTTDEVRHYMPLFALDQDGVKLVALPYSWQLRRTIHEDVAPAGATWQDERDPRSLSDRVEDSDEALAKADLPALRGTIDPRR